MNLVQTKTHSTKQQAASAEVEDQTEGQAAQADRTEEEGLLDKAKRSLQG